MLIYASKYVGAGAAPAGWTKVGSIAVDTTGIASPNNIPFSPGIDSSYDTSSYIIITDTTTAGLVGRNTGNNSGLTAAENTPTYYVSTQKTESSFVELVNRLPTRAGQTPFVVGASTSAASASAWLGANGFWTSYQTFLPWNSLNTIATYLRGYMSEFRNPSFYFYQLDGNGGYINDGGGDMYDGGNFTTPWLLSGVQYTSAGSSLGSFPFAITYSFTASTLIDTDFYYTSLGYVQYNGSSQSGQYHPLTVIGSRKETGPVGWQVGGNSGADGGGLLASGQVWGGTLSNGFTTWAYYRQTYNAGDPSHCNLIILLGHSNWNSVFGQINSFADPVGNGGNGAYYYSMTASNVLAIHTLLSKNSGVQVTLAECQTVVSNFTFRIKQALNY